MKKFLIFTLILTLALTSMALADKTNASSALDAFNKLTNQSLTPSDTAYVDNKTSAEYLTEAMAGMYVKSITDQQVAADLAPALKGLSDVTSVDIALYAGENNVPVEKVRNTYFQSLANVLRAEIMVNPASEAQYRDLQLILSLFLYNDGQNTSDIARDAIRASMTKEHAQTIAANYDLPLSFVEFMIMDDDWDDTDYLNDDAWAAEANYAWSYGDTPDNTPDLTKDNTPDNTPDYTSVVTPTAKPNVSYTNTPDNTPDAKTPDNTPDVNTPDNTPDNTPNVNTPDNTPDNT